MYECHLPCHMLMVITSFNNSLVTLRAGLIKRGTICVLGGQFHQVLSDRFLHTG